ncbi:MAG: hypothetical protein HYX79_08835 [Chloroflexi bacterium]|nr:hypothetical protein [Chloroflexota bacterium]
MAKVKPSGKIDREPLFSRHLILVISFLVTLLLSQLMIFKFVGATDLKDFWSLTLTTFGAWIGAGAAYFFGRENLKTATDSILKVRGISPEEKLEQTSLHDLKPRPIPKKFQKDKNTIYEVKEWYMEDPDRYFAVVVDNKGAVEAVLHEEGLMRYLLDRTERKLTNEKADLEQINLKEVFTFIDGQIMTYKDKGKANTANAFEGLKTCAVILKENESAKTARDNMEQKHLLLTVVVDNQGMPIGYITNTEIERVMLG